MFIGDFENAGTAIPILILITGCFLAVVMAVAIFVKWEKLQKEGPVEQGETGFADQSLGWMLIDALDPILIAGLATCSIPLGFEWFTACVIGFVGLMSFGWKVLKKTLEKVPAYSWIPTVFSILVAFLLLIYPLMLTKTEVSAF